MKKTSSVSFIKLVITFALISSAAYNVALAHGTVSYPPSRIWYCYDIDNPENPQTDGCSAAYDYHGSAQPFYDWNGVRQGDADGNHEAIIPDGHQLASGGNPSEFGGLDLVNVDWYTSAVTTGPLMVTWNNSAPHATAYYRVYITTDDWTPDMALSWDKLELLTETEPSGAASTVNIPVTLPERTGHHVIYSIWQRSDSPEAFYATSDVFFEADGDTDGDGIANADDNCPNTANPDQEDINENGIGDVCEDFNDDSDDGNGGTNDDAKVLISGDFVFTHGTSHEKYSLEYDHHEDKFIVREVEQGPIIEIKNGNLYFPNMSVDSTSYLTINTEGQIGFKSTNGGSSGGSTATTSSFNQFDFSLQDTYTGYSVYSKGLNLVQGSELIGLEALLRDNNVNTGGVDNSITVELIRRNKFSNNAVPDDVIYQVTGDNTGNNAFATFEDTDINTTGTEIVDNNTYIYFLRVTACNDCEMRTVIVME